MEDNNIRNKSFKFSIRIVNLCKHLTQTKKEYVISNQLLKAGTSIGANIAESEFAASKKDFLNKLYIALKECNESLYWLELLYKTEYLSDNEYQSIYGDCEELKKILVSSTKTLKGTVDFSEF